MSLAPKVVDDWLTPVSKGPVFLHNLSFVKLLLADCVRCCQIQSHKIS